MEDVYFLQFANKMKIHGNDYLALGNGFSDTLDLCKERGDIVWVEQDQAHGYEEKSIKLCWKRKCPIEKGIVYVSAITLLNLYQIYIWAKTKSKVNFIVGGPAVCSSIFRLEKELPHNMVITTETVEERFGVKDFSYQWKLEPPKINSEGIAFAYTIDTQCYWSKCIFCGPHSSCTRRVRPSFNFEFKNLEYSDLVFIRLNTPSFSSKNILKLRNLPNRDNFKYNLLIRGTRNESQAMKTLIETTGGKLKFVVGVGIEFPSDRMYSYVNKGIKLKEMIESIKTLSNLENVTLILTAILGWNNLTDIDIVELEKFLNEIKGQNINKIILHRLRYPHNREIHNNGKVLKETRIDPFYTGYFPKLEQIQEVLNYKARVLFHRFQKVVDRYE